MRILLQLLWMASFQRPGTETGGLRPSCLAKLQAASEPQLSSLELLSTTPAPSAHLCVWLSHLSQGLGCFLKKRHSWAAGVAQ